MFNLMSMASRVKQYQQIMPASDVSTTGWTTTPLWSKINVVNQDTDFVSSTLAGGRKQFTVGLATPLDPGIDTGWSLDLSMRWSPSGGDPPAVGALTRVSLLQGATLIEQQSFNSDTLSNSFSVFTFNFNPLNIVNITVFSNLRVTIDYDPGGLGLNNQADVSWIRLNVPGA